MKNIDVITLYSTMKGKKVEYDGKIGTICGYRKSDFIIGFNDFSGWTIPDNYDMIGKSFPSYGYISMYNFIDKAEDIKNKNNYLYSLLIIFGFILFSLIYYFNK
jgi:hypothetical protein